MVESTFEEWMKQIIQINEGNAHKYVYFLSMEKCYLSYAYGSGGVRERVRMQMKRKCE